MILVPFPSLLTARSDSGWEMQSIATNCFQVIFLKSLLTNDLWAQLSNNTRIFKSLIGEWSLCACAIAVCRRMFLFALTTVALTFWISFNWEVWIPFDSPPQLPSVDLLSWVASDALLLVQSDTWCLPLHIGHDRFDQQDWARCPAFKHIKHLFFCLTTDFLLSTSANLSHRFEGWGALQNVHEYERYVCPPLSLLMLRFLPPTWRVELGIVCSLKLSDAHRSLEVTSRLNASINNSISHHHVYV